MAKRWIKSTYYDMIFLLLYTGTRLLIMIIDATWNVNACYYHDYEVPYASRDRYACDVPHPLS